ncbi:MAG: hypothetical protein HY303_07680 [Candidatus Wallbacteria bacterium]|nr:hypothetical protein [Candidatus Wallbacteria bacterium]
MAFRVLGPGPVLRLAIAAALLAAVPSAARAAAGTDVRPLMERLFHLVKRNYAEIATLDAKLRRPDTGTDAEAVEGRLAEKIAAFQERDRKIVEKIPHVESADPELGPQLEIYRNEIQRMERRVNEMSRSHGLEQRVFDLVAARRAEDGDGDNPDLSRNPPPGVGDDWETGRAGSPMPSRRSNVLAGLGSKAVGASASGSSGGDMDDLVQKIREQHVGAAEKQIEIDLGGPRGARGTARLAAKSSQPEDRLVPVVIEVRDESDRPVSRRRVEFIVDTDPGSPISAALFDSGSHVKATSLVEITDDSGQARVDLRIDGDDRKVRIERTVVPQPDRTVCRMHVSPM